MHTHIGCICLTFLHCVFSYVSSKHLHCRMHNHTGCICSIFLRCVFSNVFSKRLPKQMQSHTDCTCDPSLLSVCLTKRSERDKGSTSALLVLAAYWLPQIIKMKKRKLKTSLGKKKLSLIQIFTKLNVLQRRDRRQMLLIFEYKYKVFKKSKHLVLQIFQMFFFQRHKTLQK